MQHLLNDGFIEQRVGNPLYLHVKFCFASSPPATAKSTTTIAVHLGRSLAEVAHSTEVLVYLRGIILREVKFSIGRDMHQTICIVDKNFLRAGPCRLDAAV